MISCAPHEQRACTGHQGSGQRQVVEKSLTGPPRSARWCRRASCSLSFQPSPGHDAFGHLTDVLRSIRRIAEVQHVVRHAVGRIVATDEDTVDPGGHRWFPVAGMVYAAADDLAGTAFMRTSLHGTTAI